MRPRSLQKHLGKRLASGTRENRLEIAEGEHDRENKHESKSTAVDQRRVSMLSLRPRLT